MYRLFKTNRLMEKYISEMDIQMIRDAMTRFRLGISEIYVHKHRFHEGNVDLICPSCNEEDEDETHFLLHCPVYEDFREKYLGITNLPRNHDTFVNLMTCNEHSMIVSICLYLHHAFRRRRAALSDENE